MGHPHGTNTHRLALLVVSGLTVAMLLVMVGRSNRIIMLAKTSSPLLIRSFSTFSSSPSSSSTSSRPNDCSTRMGNSSQGTSKSCLRYEVYLIQKTGSGNDSSFADVALIRELLSVSECRMMYFYALHVVSYQNSGTRPVNLTLRLVNESIQRCTNEGALVSLDFIEIPDRSRAAVTLDDRMTDSYVFQNVDFVSVVFESGFNDGSSSSSSSSQASTSSFLSALEKFRPKNVGVVFQGGSTGSPGRVFFAREHFEVFGFYLPPTLIDLEQLPTVLRKIYPEEKLTTIGSSSSSKEITKSTPSQSPSFDPSEHRDALNRYVQASAFNPCLRCPNSTSRQVIAMSLYGSDPRYTMGAIRNAQLLPVVFPGWRLRFYAEKPDSAGATKYSRVPDKVIAKLVELGAEIVVIDAAAAGLAPMLWRFTAMDDESIDIFTVRDCDSRLTSRDAAVVSDWLTKTNNLFHCIRDHPSHSNYAISGGLWGARRKPFHELFGSLRTAMKRFGAGYVEDMNFLGQDVWPKVSSDRAYCHDSYSCDRFPSSHAFPVARIGYEHLGQVYDRHSIGRQGDIDILKNAAVNPKCVPS